ncbi:heat shock protein HspQ [Alteriqipengyuania lutimaris]|uniref:Heat shock protein HspQ n=1 Tax=Alteriqipengyuania lutimaris TaxID=1538146 RepID=A0A395LM58_9SPHN|nr:heat shock protein HspQ [Alteriqipengyuania lutimaris]MBB3035092.1 heat shock protein HspQ [Alteriqipengyuania lutimaris]RDS75710.1 heat shock protein HspQ [Alteriqipengyuania lutimaris]
MQLSQFFSHQAGRHIDVPFTRQARFGVGDVVRHKMFDFRGVVFDIDPTFANSEEWYESIPAHIRPERDQPYYHLFAESDDAYYVAYVSQQNLVADGTGGPVDHPSISDMFDDFADGRYVMQPGMTH